MYNAEYVNLLKTNSISNINILIDFEDSDSFPTLTNDDILDDGFELNRSICEGDGLLFGTVTAAELRFRLAYSDKKYVGQKCNVSFYLNNDPTMSIPVGTFIIDSDVPDGTRETVEITAHDELYALQSKDVSAWYRGLAFPLTLKNFRNQLFAHIGLAHENTTLVNDNMLVEKTIDSDFIPATELIKAICEANASFGRIDRNGTFEYVRLNQSSTVDVGSNLYYDVTYENYNTDLFTGVIIRQEENDIGGQYGTDESAYVIENNFLFYGKTTDDLIVAAQHIFNMIQSITMVPFDITMWSIAVDPGDRLRISTPFGETITTYALNVSTSGILDMEDNITNSIRKEQAGGSGGIMYDIKQLKGKSNVLERNVEETRMQIADVEQGLRNEITATAGEFDVKIQQIQQELDGDIQQYNVTEEPNLTNFPSNTFTYNIPCNNTVQIRDDLPFVYTEEWYRKNARSMAYDATTGIVYRFQKENDAWVWKPIPNTEYGELKKSIADLNVKTDGISASVSAVEYKIDNNYFTKEETEAKLDITSEKIETKVSKGDVSSQVSQESDKISIKSNRFSLDSTNCKIQEDGSIVAKNIDIQGGKINISSSSRDYDFITLAYGTSSMNVTPTYINVGTSTSYMNLRNSQIDFADGSNKSGLSNARLYIEDLRNSMDIASDKITLKNSSNATTEIDATKVKTSTIDANSVTTKGIDVGSLFSAKLTTSSPTFGEVNIGQSLTKIGFFGHLASLQKSVANLSSTASTSTITAKVNELLNALKDYGLIK